jgi:hypothetical protein
MSLSNPNGTAGSAIGISADALLSFYLTPKPSKHGCTAVGSGVSALIDEVMDEFIAVMTHSPRKRLA